MPFEINPAYRDLLASRGLVRAEHFLELPGVVISGHPDRHVVRVSLGDGTGAFLKREHRVPWLDRLVSACAGFGPVSKSVREALLLQSAQKAGIGCPDWIAAGEDGTGRAFLLLRELPESMELRLFLHQARPGDRRRLARALGLALANMHAAGFEHRDLFAKHVLVQPRTRALAFLDWPRARRRPCLGWPRRWHDLAALHATLADDLAGPAERLICLRAYLRATAGRERRADDARQIHEMAGRLLRKRHVRNQRLPPLRGGVQNVVWLDGEALCVTREFWSEVQGRLPDWLVGGYGRFGFRFCLLRTVFQTVRNTPGRFEKPSYEREDNQHPSLTLRDRTETAVPLPGGARGLLTRWSQPRPLAWLRTLLRLRPDTSPALRQAAVLFRLQRHGLVTPRLLAFGQRPSRAALDSFFLTEPVAGSMALSAWLAHGRLPQRPVVLRQAGGVLRRLHEAGCWLGGRARQSGRHPLCVRSTADDGTEVVIGCVSSLQTRRRITRRMVLRDLRCLRDELAAAGGGRSDVLRLLFGYLGLPRLTPAARKMAARVGLSGSLARKGGAHVSVAGRLDAPGAVLDVATGSVRPGPAPVPLRPQPVDVA
jgi:Lipopolysaccharide kinase (Kdo/WaaP) family